MANRLTGNIIKALRHVSFAFRLVTLRWIYIGAFNNTVDVLLADIKQLEDGTYKLWVKYVYYDTEFITSVRQINLTRRTHRLLYAESYKKPSLNVVDAVSDSLWAPITDNTPLALVLDYLNMRNIKNV